MSILFLDDNKERCKQFKSLIPRAMIVHTVQDCIAMLKDEDEWNMLLLDHDLGGEIYVDSNREDTGMEVVRWIVQHQPIIREIVVHTHNTPAGINMVDILNDAKYKAHYIPFAQMIKNIEGNKHD